MKVTSELLERYGATDDWKKEFEEFELEGKEFIEVLHSGASSAFINFLKTYLSLDKEEEKEYRKLYSIDENSKNIFDSSFVENSKNIGFSTEIRDSENVEGCSKIIEGKFVYDSSDVQRSINVLKSKYVRDSSEVIYGEYVFDSEKVLHSSEVDWSTVISNCDHVDSCQYLYECSDIAESYFCGFCEHSDHCIFCIGLKDAAYMIFNEPVSVAEFEEWREKLLFKLMGEQSKFIEINHSLYYLGDERFIYGNYFDNIFNGLSSDFFGWVGNFKNFSEDNFLNLFFTEK